MKTTRELTTEIKTNTKRLRMQGLLRRREESLKQFLIKFFLEWNIEKNTLQVETRKIDVGPGKRRSLGDIFMIVKYYYPKATLLQVTRHIYNDLFQEIPRFRCSYCNTIKKRVFYQGTEQQDSNIYDKTIRDEYNLTHVEWQQIIA